MTIHEARLWAWKELGGFIYEAWANAAACEAHFATAELMAQWLANGTIPRAAPWAFVTPPTAPSGDPGGSGGGAEG